MLGLKLETDPRWVNTAASNLEEILTDHAWCEQKAASNAISLITLNPDKPEMVTQLLQIATEELDHFRQVHEIILLRGYEFGRERKDDYVNRLYQFCKRGGSRTESLVDRLLFSAMVEARSCERFKVLSENIEDEALGAFYYELMISEANHYKVFITFARNYGDGIDVNRRWSEWLNFEGELIKSYGKAQTIHG